MTNDRLEKPKSLKQYARVCIKVEKVLRANGMRLASPAATAAGVKTTTVLDHLNKGTIPGILVDTRWLVPEGVIEAALQAGVFTIGRGSYVRGDKRGKRKKTPLGATPYSRPKAGDGAG